MEHGLLAVRHFLSAKRPGRNDDWVVARGHRRKQSARHIRCARFFPTLRNCRAGASDLDDARAWRRRAGVPSLLQHRAYEPTHRVGKSNGRALVYAAALIE